MPQYAATGSQTVPGRIIKQMTRLTREFRWDRYRFALIGAEEYLRAFWWFVIPVPIGGAIAVSTGIGYLQLLGIIALLWPLTIPSRAFLASSKASRIFTQSAWLGAEGDKLYLFGPGDLGMKLDLSSVRAVVSRKRYDAILTRRLGVLPVPRDAWLEADLPNELRARIDELREQAFEELNRAR